MGIKRVTKSTLSGIPHLQNMKWLKWEDKSMTERIAALGPSVSKNFEDDQYTCPWHQVQYINCNRENMAIRTSMHIPKPNKHSSSGMTSDIIKWTQHV